MSIVATDTEQALAQIAAMADSSGGWWSKATSTSLPTRPRAATSAFAFRPRASRACSTPSPGWRSKLTARARRARTTEEFVDLSARLGNMEATAARLRQFLADAENVEEALAVNVELSRVEGDINRCRVVSSFAAVGGLLVNHRQCDARRAGPAYLVGGWQPSGVAKEAIRRSSACFRCWPTRSSGSCSSPRRSC